MNVVRKIIAKARSVVKRFEPSKHKWPIAKLIEGAKLAYENTTGLTLDVERPVLFTDKVIWYKLFYEHPDLGRIVDKYDFKGYIREKLGDNPDGGSYTTRAYGVYESLDELRNDWANLPETFVLKSTLQSDGKCIKVVKRKSETSFASMRKELREWFKLKNTLVNSYCRAYYSCKPRVLAEEYISQMDDDQLYDYKIFCFNGKPFCFYIALDHFKDEDYPIMFFDLEWNKMDVKYGAHDNSRDVPKPKRLAEMLAIAEKLSKEFPFVRVDFFDTGEKLYMAELTFYPGGGVTRYEPYEFNKRMGDLFILPERR